MYTRGRYTANPVGKLPTPPIGYMVETVRPDTAELPVDGGSLRAIAALQDDTRRAVYASVRQAHRPLTREQAAAEVGISRKLAGFHLDKLVDAGLLTARYDPAARSHTLGRTPKTYQPAERDIAVTIPARQPALLADLLIEAITTARPDETPRHAAERVATARGRQLGEAALAETRPGRLGTERAITLAETVLRARGFEPVRESPTRLRLHNCPFQPLAAAEPDLVCQLNHRMISGFLDGLRTTAVEAALSPRAGECCVQLQAAR